MLTLASYLEERAAKLKREALGRCQVAFAGSPPNSLHFILDQFFGFKDDAASEASATQDPLQSFTCLLTDEPVPAAPRSFMASAEAAVARLSAEQAAPPQATTALPPHLRPGSKAKSASQLFSGSESEGGRQHPGPLSTHAQVFKPGPEEKYWSRTGLAKEYQPQSREGKYYCPMCRYYEGHSNIDTVSTHIQRDHLNISLGCHYCDKAFFSSEGWKKHNVQKHKKSKDEFVPEGAVDPGTAAKIPDHIELEEVKAEEASAIEESIGLSGNLNAEAEFEEGDEVEIMDVEGS